MKYIGLIAILLTITCSLYSQNKVLSKIPLNGTSIKAFIPTGYDTMMIARGDLNKDGLEDVVMALRSTMEDIDSLQTDEDGFPPRLLVILFKARTQYKLAGKSDSALLCKDCGGIFGDPFANISIERGVLQIHFYGGSNWRWANNYKFRYQENNFKLIGATKLSFWNVENCESLGEFAGTEFLDINYVTGQYEEKKISQEGCKLLLHKKGKKKIQPLIALQNFSAYDEQ